jgi:HAD superfamily phosphatase (TIGR01668 family)
MQQDMYSRGHDGGAMKGILLPRLYVDSIAEITADVLKKIGIKGLILDIDNTLVPNHVADADDNVLEWTDAMKAAGFKLCIVSNGARKRVARFNEKLGLFAVHRAMKPAKRAFLKAGMVMGLESRQIAVVGDQIFTDVYGGNRLGMFTILVKPIDRNEGKFVKLKRIFEKRIIRGLSERQGKGVSGEFTDDTG